MPIDFFTSGCKSTTSKDNFGLCDDPPPANDPAYIDEVSPEKWIAEVENKDEVSIDFHAIDNCVEVLRPNGEKENRCDCILHYGDSLIFVELKDRASTRWLAKGSKQISAMLNRFKENHDMSSFDKVEAYVCNKQKPLARTGNNVAAQRFKDETGLTLRTDRKIKIE